MCNQPARWIVVPLIALAIFTIPASPTGAGEAAARPEPTIRIDILDCRWPSDVYGYTNEEVRPQLEACARKAPLFTVESADVASYCWDRHVITLTIEGTERLLAAVGDVWERHHGGNRAFAVKLGDEWLYGGVFYLEYGAAAIQFPVIHLERQGDRLGFRIRDGLYGSDGSQPIALKVVRKFFRDAGKLGCEPPDTG